MKTHLMQTIPALFVLCLGCQGNVSRGTDIIVFLEPLSADDLAVAPGGANLISGVTLADAVNFEKSALGLSWRVDKSIHEAPKPYVAKSRQFWTSVSAAQLVQGFSLTVTSPGAILKLSPNTPTSSSPKALLLDDLIVTDAA